MKKQIKSIIICSLLTLLGSFVFANENKNAKVSATFDILNTSNWGALNLEVSPNQYLDFGVGFSPLYFHLLPEGEIHTFARLCLFDYFIQPYVQLGVSLVDPGVIPQYGPDGNFYEYNRNVINARIGTGIKISIGKIFFCGAGVNYSFIGQNLLERSFNFYGISPAIFLGGTVFRF